MYMANTESNLKATLQVPETSALDEWPMPLVQWVNSDLRSAEPFHVHQLQQVQEQSHNTSLHERTP